MKEMKSLNFSKITLKMKNNFRWAAGHLLPFFSVPGTFTSLLLQIIIYESSFFHQVSQNMTTECFFLDFHLFYPNFSETKGRIIFSVVTKSSQAMT